MTQDTLDLSPLTAISPLDGRYARITAPLRAVFSEYGLIRQRVAVEVRWLLALSQAAAIKEIPAFTKKTQQQLEEIISCFSESDARRVKEIEATTNHDVKAVEYFLKEKTADNKEISSAREFFHFACTSEDINNLAHALILKSGRDDILLPQMSALIESLEGLANEYAALPMLSRTHGQPASPTTLGKEMANFAHRLQRQYRQIEDVVLLGKMNGAVGNYNAHLAAYPEIDWPELTQVFITDLGLQPNP